MPEHSGGRIGQERKVPLDAAVGTNQAICLIELPVAGQRDLFEGKAICVKAKVIYSAQKAVVARHTSSEQNGAIMGCERTIPTREQCAIQVNAAFISIVGNGE